MAEPLHILVAGRHPEIVPTLVRLLHQTPAWQATGTLTNQEAFSCMDCRRVDVLLLSSGLSVQDEEELRRYLNRTQPHAITVQHYGGGSGLLIAEIYEALAAHQ